jgi:3-carboxy-cis,cis-muconate cycloisomerase
MSVSPFDHPLLGALVGDDETADRFTAAAELEAMVAFEQALAQAEARLGVIPGEAGTAISAALDRFTPDMAALRAASANDGVVVPELVRQLRASVGHPLGGHLHVGATSQDVIDTALAIRLKPVLASLERRLAKLIEALADLDRHFGARRLIAVTRMQPALPISVAGRIAAWRQPLERNLSRLRDQRPRLLVVQFGGAAGTLDGLGEAGPAVRAALAERLDLADAPQWHSQRDAIADFASALSLVTAGLGKLGQDVALMALDGNAIGLAGGGRSSAMPHKHNPVKAEMLETLARFNAVQVGAMHQAAIHPMERSGAAWTLEWLVLPQMVVATGASLRLAGELISSVETLGE